MMLARTCRVGGESIESETAARSRHEGAFDEPAHHRPLLLATDGVRRDADTANQSAGANNDRLPLRFPAGIPAQRAGPASANEPARRADGPHRSAANDGDWRLPQSIRPARPRL